MNRAIRIPRLGDLDFRPIGCGSVPASYGNCMTRLDFRLKLTESVTERYMTRESNQSAEVGTLNPEGRWQIAKWTNGVSLFVNGFIVPIEVLSLCQSIQAILRLRGQLVEVKYAAETDCCRWDRCLVYISVWFDGVVEEPMALVHASVRGASKQSNPWIISPDRLPPDTVPDMTF